MFKGLPVWENDPMKAKEGMMEVRGFWVDASGAVRSGSVFECSAEELQEFIDEYGMDEQGYDWLEVDGVRCFG